MHRLLIALALALTLAGCGSRAAIKPDPVPESCAAQCRTPCNTKAPAWSPADPDDPAAWDQYPLQVALPLWRQLQACSVSRTACVQCLDRLKEAGVTK